MRHRWQKAKIGKKFVKQPRRIIEVTESEENESKCTIIGTHRMFTKAFIVGIWVLSIN